MQASSTKRNTGKCFVQALRFMFLYWDMFCSSFVAKSSTGICLMLTVWYKVGLGGKSWKLFYWTVCCAKKY